MALSADTRAEIEGRHGYDTKHAVHLVRLMPMGFEILQTGELRVRRPDTEELNAIRDSALTYDELNLWMKRSAATHRSCASASA